VVVTSFNYVPADSPVARIKRLDILWGCLGKGTVVHTPDGIRKITELQVGSRVLAADGEYHRVKNIITGTEENMVAVAIKGEPPLLLSENHALDTQRGLVVARDLTAADSVRTQEGLEHLSYLERVPYNDSVYSLELDDSALIYANDIAVADYATKPQAPPKPPESETASLDEELAHELDEWIEWKRESLAAQTS
jgi:hypothetical protein